MKKGILALLVIGACWGAQLHAKEGINWEVAHFVEVEMAAEKGDADAQNELGVMYVQGQGVAQDYKLATIWLRKAAEQGIAMAQSNLGMMYHDGQGVEQDFQQALIWYRKAAAQGNAVAQLNLGLMYTRGQGVAKDDKQAVDWLHKAAEQGDADAQYALGVMYDNGMGDAKDHKQALAWYRKAAEQGHADAQKALDVMPSEKQWWVANSSFSECFKSGGPAAKLDEFVGFTDKPYTQDHRDSSGNLVKVEVINANGNGQETVWTYYKEKSMCEAEQVKSTQALADKYR